MRPAHRDALPMWTVYDHPKDYPGDFIARRWLVEAGETCATDDIMVGPLEALRRALRRMGLVCMPRSDGDDPVIVETWL